MRVELFDFDLPAERIALRPVFPRDSARLLVVNNGLLRDQLVKQLPDFLQPGDVMVFNDTRVIPARLHGKRGDAKVEVTLHKSLGQGKWRVFAKPAKRLRVGDHFIIAEDFSAQVVAKTAEGEVELAFNCEGEVLFAQLKRYGTMPLPPYIRREEKADQQDDADYQTVYSRHEGAVAAPTAGLHFTPELLQQLDAKGVQRVFVTLHVGAGTFLPVKAEDTKDHKMHSEFAHLTADVAATINAARAKGGRIVAVGTTSMRVLESAADAQGQLHAYAGDTDIFITPGYAFRAVDVLMTNFHLPKSTLFMLVSAFSGLEVMKQAYQHAIEKEYRFYSYGDACLLHRAG